MSSTSKISILGTEATGKTVLLAALTHALASATTFPHITAKNATTLRYTARVYDQLELGEWPKSTDVGVRQNLRWLWHASDQSQHELQTFDCSGQDFRTIFESESDDELNPQQLALKNEFYDSDLILLLFNFHEALKIHKVPAKNVARLELSYAPAAAVEKLRKAGVATYVVFTQADLYAERVKREWDGDFSRALEEVLPDLHFALERTGSPYEYIAAVETEERQGKSLPKEGCKTGNLSVLIKSVDEFLVKNKDVVRQPVERKTAEEPQVLEF
jgi:GTPase SAR1 family protein